MNCMAVDIGGHIIVVDCGVTFPHTDIGVDVYHPDFDYLEQRRERVRGIVITHGHEDHIGALPYLLRRINAPLWGPAHALNLAGERLEERGFELRALRMHPIRPGQVYELGPLTIEPIRVSHSITEACAIVIRGAGRTILHTGDFKFDSDPPDGEPTDEARLRQVGDEGVDLLLSDSTNIDAEGHSGSERTVGQTIEQLVAAASKRVIVGMFASNVQRMQMVGDIAKRAGRRVCLVGRSVRTQVRVATRLGRLRWPSDLLIPPEAIGSLPRSRVLVIASGTQAEPYAALFRLSNRTHPAFVPDAGDTLLLSSRIIPGNDPAVMRMIGNFIRQGLHVHSRITDPAIHVSGHAHRQEQRKMLELVRPRAFMPVHGTLHHLKRHGELAREVGIEQVLVAENGDVVELTEGSLRKVKQVQVGKIATYEGEEIPDDVLREREALGRTGIAVVTLMVDARGQLLAPPFLSTRGVLDEDESVELLRAATLDIAKSLAGKPFTSERPTDADIIEVAERAVRRNLDGITGRRPLAVVHVVRP